MKNFILFLSLFVFLAINTESKAQPYYYNSGIPTLFENWGNLPGGDGAHPSSFGENTEYIIESGKSPVLDFQWFVDGTATLRINTGGSLQVNYSLNIGSNAKFILDSNATCIYNSTELARTTLFAGKEIFHAYSNFKINNWPGINEAVVDSISATGEHLKKHLFGNLELNWEGLIGNWNINAQHNSGAGIICANDFRITSSGKGKIIIPIPGYPVSSYLSSRNYIQTGGEVDLALGSPIVNNSAGIIRIFGNFQKTGGTIDGNSVTAFGKIEIFFDTSFSSSIHSVQDTAYQTFQNSGTLRNTGYEILECRLRLMSNMPTTSTIPACSTGVYYSILDCNNYKVTGNTELRLQLCTVKLRSPEGFKNGASGGNFTIAGAKKLFRVNFDYCGSVPQVTGDSLPVNLKDETINNLDQYITINNPNGVTLSKDMRMGNYSKFTFIQGKLNLGNHNFKMLVADSIKGVNENCFFNTNGTGYCRVGINDQYVVKAPVGNGTFSPVMLTQIYSGSTDTIGFRVENAFAPGQSPFDTSRSVRKVWKILDENMGNVTYSRVCVQFMKSDAGSNMDYSKPISLGQYDAVYNGYVPGGGFQFEPFFSPPDSTVSRGMSSSTSYVTTGEDIYIAGNEDGVYETYYPDNSGEASILGNWASLNGLHPQSFDRYAIFTVPQGQTATFNNSATLSGKAWLRATGNGVINANAPLFINGVLELKDSCTYNHNNTAPPSQSCFGGREFVYKSSTFQILMWSDTTDKVFDELEGSYGNLVINFNNLPEPFGTNKYWTVFKNSYVPYMNTYYVRGNLTYIQSSGYQFAPIGFGNRLTSLYVYGNVQIGDSLHPTAYPVMNLSGGTTRAADTTAGTLFISGNLDIQSGGLTSQDFPVVARGKMVFNRETASIPQNHTFYCYKPFLPQTSYLGNAAFPNLVESDTLTLKSDMYNWASGLFIFTDAWQINSGAVLNIDTFKIKSLNLIVKNGGKLVTKNREGFYADLATQTVTFEPNSTLEFAGTSPQNFQKEGSYNLTSFPNITINNPSGVTVNTPGITITNSITLLNGKLISDNTNYLTIPEGTQFNNASNSSFLSGPIRINTASTGIKTIPLGKGNTMRGIVIIPSNSNSTDWTVEYFNQQQSFGTTLGPGLNKISSAEYFLINRSGTSNAVVGLSWGANSGVSEPNNLRVARWTDFQWEDKGISGFVGDATAGIVFSNMVTEFSPFVIGAIDNQELPVELSSFSAAADKNNVTLNWVTETEENNSGYDVERKSASDTMWKKVSFVQGAGNSNSSKNYKYEDRNLATGKYSYRLKQIDYNGNFTYYNLQNEINVGVPVKFNLSQNYPNPFNPSTKINFDLPEDTKVSINVFDITGRLMTTIVNNQNFTAGYHTVDFSAGSLSSGTYFYRISAGNNIQTKKMMLVK